MMRKLFAVTRVRGPIWEEAISMEQQDSWRSHADFMNSLQEEGFVVLGGPLNGTSEVLLIISAESEDQIHARLSSDPWGPRMLTTARIAGWTLRIGHL